MVDDAVTVGTGLLATLTETEAIHPIASFTRSFSFSTPGTYQLCVDAFNDCVLESANPAPLCKTITVIGPETGTITAVPDPACPNEIVNISTTGYGANEKYILKKAGEGIVPEEILKRKKFPFQAPGMSAMVKKSGGKLEFLEESLLKKYGIFDVGYVNEMKKVYSQSDFKLMGAYEIDYLLIVMTVTMLCERFSLSV